MHGFRMAEDQAQRGAQLMSDIGGHLFAGVDRARELGTHPVECLGKLAQLVIGTDRYLLG